MNLADRRPSDLGPKDVGAKAGWLQPGALKMATPSLIATTFICPDSNLLELPRSRTHNSLLGFLFDKWELIWEAVVTYWGLSSFHDSARVLDWSCKLLHDRAFATPPFTLLL